MNYDAVRWLEKRFDLLWELGGEVHYVEDPEYAKYRHYRINWSKIPQPYYSENLPTGYAPLMIMIKTDL